MNTRNPARVFQACQIPAAPASCFLHLHLHPDPECSYSLPYYQGERGGGRARRKRGNEKVLCCLVFSSCFAEPPPEPTFALLVDWSWRWHGRSCVPAGGSQFYGLPQHRRGALLGQRRASLVHVSIALPGGSVMRYVLLQAVARKRVLRIGPEAVEPVVLGRLLHTHGGDAVQGTVVAAGVGRVACRLRRAAAP